MMLVDDPDRRLIEHLTYETDPDGAGLRFRPDGAGRTISPAICCLRSFRWMWRSFWPIWQIRTALPSAMTPPASPVLLFAIGDGNPLSGFRKGYL